MDYEKLAEQYPFDLSLVSLDGEEMNYVVKFKEYPDVIGTGASAKEAIDEAYGNLSVLLEYLSEQSKTIIPPSVHIVTEEPSGRITLRMSKTLHANLIERADQEGMSVNSIVNEALAKFLYEKEDESWDNFDSFLNFTVTNLSQMKSHVTPLLPVLEDGKENDVVVPPRNPTNAGKAQYPMA